VLVLTLVGASGCIAPSVLDRENRAIEVTSAEIVWAPATAADLPGFYVSAELSGALAASVRGLVYRFFEDGSFTGAALLDGDPPHFEVLTGTWELADGLRLDGAPPALLEVAPGGSLRLSGDEGVVVLRRERDL